MEELDFQSYHIIILKASIFQQQIIKHTKQKQENMGQKGK